MKAGAQRNTFKNDLKLSAEFEGGIITYTDGSSRVIDRFFLNSRKMRGFEPEEWGLENASMEYVA